MDAKILMPWRHWTPKIESLGVLDVRQISDNYPAPKQRLNCFKNRFDNHCIALNFSSTLWTSTMNISQHAYGLYLRTTHHSRELVWIQWSGGGGPGGSRLPYWKLLNAGSHRLGALEPWSRDLQPVVRGGGRPVGPPTGQEKFKKCSVAQTMAQTEA